MINTNPRSGSLPWSSFSLFARRPGDTVADSTDAVTEKDDSVRVDAVCNIGDLTPSNGYELQILSGFDNYRGQRITQYRFPSLGKDETLALNAELNSEKSKFYASLDSSVFDLNEKKTKNVTSAANCTPFECDLYFCSENRVPSIRMLLSSATEEVWKLTNVPYVEPLDEPVWIFMEISQGSKLIAQKIWQTERATRILPIHDQSFFPSAVVILLNGQRDEVDKVVAAIVIPASFKISKLPVYVGWTPTRNIHKSFTLLKNEIRAQSEQISSLVKSSDAQSEQISSLVKSSDAQSEQFNSKLTAQSEQINSKLTAQSEQISAQFAQAKWIFLVGTAGFVFSQPGILNLVSLVANAIWSNRSP